MNPSFIGEGTIQAQPLASPPSSNVRTLPFKQTGDRGNQIMEKAHTNRNLDVYLP
jgi:hypothetical protein